MILSQEDGDLYYELWRPLLDFVNNKYHASSELKNIATAKRLPEDKQAIVRGWKRRIQGTFMMERHLKKGTIFISMEDEKVYQVSGIKSSWEEMFYGAPMPLLAEATFIPFRDVIISDGLVVPYRVIIGGNMKREYKDVYMAAKKSGQIYRSL